MSIENLKRFRQENPLRVLEHANNAWHYYRVGDEALPALLLFPSQGAHAEALFRYMTVWQTQFSVIAPNIPHTVHTIDALLDGTIALLQAENIASLHVVGMGAGGAMAQALLRRNTAMVRDAVITHTSPPDPALLTGLKQYAGLARWIPERLLMNPLARVMQQSIQTALDPASETDRAFWQAYYAEHYRTQWGKRDVLGRVKLISDYHSMSTYQSTDLKAWTGRLLIIDSDSSDDEGLRGAVKMLYPSAYTQTLAGYSDLAPLLASEVIAPSIARFLSPMRA